MLTPDEARFVRWWDFLWFLIPIAGIAGFVAQVKAREERSR